MYNALVCALRVIQSGYYPAMTWTTSAIYRRLQAPDADPAWLALLERFWVPLTRFAQRAGLSPEEAEDAAQEALMGCMTSLRDGHYDRSKGRLSTWMFGIALRQVMSIRRHAAIRENRIRGGYETHFWNSVGAAPPHTADWIHEWERVLMNQLLEEARAHVAPATYQAFELVVRAGWSPADTAVKLHMTVKAVYNAKHRVLKCLRRLRDVHETSIIEGTKCTAPKTGT